MTLTKQAKEDFNKIFHKDYKQDEIEPIIAKKNWHREKQKNKEKEIYKRAKQSYPRWLFHKSKEFNFNSYHTNNPIKVEVNRQNEIVYRLRNGSAKYYSKMVPIKDCLKKGIYNQYVSSWVRLNRYGQNYINYFGLPTYYTQVNQSLYVTSLICNGLKTEITSSFPLFPDESIREITKKDLVYYIQENIKKDNILSYGVFTKTLSAKRFNKANKVMNFFDFIDWINNIDNFFYFEESPQNNLKSEKKYSKLRKKIKNEIHFYSGMRKLSKGKTKLKKDLKDIITYSNLIFKTTDKNFFNNDCFLKDKEIVTWIPACLDCQKNGWEYCPEGELNINYPSSMFIMDVEPLYSDVRKNYETWEYIY